MSPKIGWILVSYSQYWQRLANVGAISDILANISNLGYMGYIGKIFQYCPDDWLRFIYTWVIKMSGI